MTVPAWTEVQLAVGGALRLACGDRRGLGFFDPSLDGFWRSFRAAVLTYPLYLVLLGFRVTGAQLAHSGLGTIVIVETIAYVISWTALPLLILPLARGFGLEQRFLPFMVAYNWSQLPQTALIVVVALDRAAGLLPGSAGAFLELAAIVATLVYEWFIARVALNASGAQAVLVIMVDVALGTLLGQVTERLY
jgi:hypothetical protein